jgi:hypothetical protein
VLRRAFSSEFDFGHGERRVVPHFTVFHRHGANEPSGDKAAWVLQHIRTSGLCPEPAAINFALGRRVFRADLFESAARLRGLTSTNHETKRYAQLQPALA